MITIPICPVPQPRARVRIGNGRVWSYTPGEADAAKAAIVMYCKRLKLMPRETPVRVDIRFVLPKPASVKRDLPCVKPDLDNLVKLVLDALNGVAWTDDSQVVELHTSKVYGQPGIILEIEEV